MKKIFYLPLILLLFATACTDNPDDSSVNIFTVEDDIKLGKQLDDTIMASPQEYPVLPRSQYMQAYLHLERIADSILNSGKVFYADKFPWTFRIIRDDNTLNAFATPGGFIYVYTGLIKYLETEDQLAGVLAHEIAHSDRRHTTDMLTKRYGLELLLAVALGENSTIIGEIAAGLASLSFSRDAEEEADKYSVIYLCPTSYEADGAADFFQKIIDQGGSGGTPEFLSTHPNPDNRVQKIQQEAVNLNCQGDQTYPSRYQQFINSLP